MLRPLKDLLAAIDFVELEGDLEKGVRGVVLDSRRVEEGSLFVAMQGLKGDGHRHLQDAARRGAVAVVHEGKTGEGFVRHPGVAAIQVADSRRALAALAAAFYGHPSSRMTLIGVTGTNGKTTTSHLVESILDAAGCRVGYIGTLGYRWHGHTVPTALTTPEAPDLQRILSEMASRGVSHAVLEVSSHALKFHRADGCRFRVGVFTNLTRDHLDFHGTMEDYFASKRRLFRELGVGAAVVNGDDPRSIPLLEDVSAPTLTYRLEDRADIWASEVRMSSRGLSLVACTPQGQIPLESPLMGKYNIYNILAAVGTAQSLGVGREEIRRGVGLLKGVPGRFERVEADQDFLVIVDYAHTEDALERLLRAARELSSSRLITVFGCGGDRDRGKRPRMGQVAAGTSDYAIITSDNPRSEDPGAIIRDIEQGVRQAAAGAGVSGRTRHEPPGGDRYEILVDRREAIHRAIGIAEPGDVVVIAGKGHEPYQILGDTTIHFDDREVAREALQLKMQKAR